MKKFSRLQLIITATSLVVFLVSFIIFYGYTSQTISNMQSEQLILDREILEFKISNEFQDVGASIDHLSFYVKVYGESNLLDYMVELSDKNETIFSIYYLTVDNAMTNSSGYTPPPTIDFRERIWYTSALETEGITYSPAFLNASEDKMIVTISKAVYSETEVLLGVIAADINIITIQSLVTNEDVGETGYAFLIDINNNILAHPSTDLNDLELKSADTINSEISEWVGSNVIEDFKLDSIKGTVTYAQIVNDSYKLILFIPNQEYNEANNLVFVIFIILAGGILVVSVLMSILNNAFVYNPFKKLLKDIESIDIDSNLDYRLSLEEKKGFIEIRKGLNNTLNTTSQYFEKNKEIHNELLYEHQKVILLMESTADIIFEIDTNKSFISIYGKGLEKIKMTSEQFISKNILDVFGEEGIERDNIYDNVLNGTPSVYDWKIKVDGDYLYFESSLSPIFDNDKLVVGAVGISRDITEAKQKQDQINFLNYHDYLTELNNRRYYFKQFKLLNKAEYLPLGIMMLDVNGLKIINDAFGHATGDLALTAISDILRKTFEEKDVVSRIGGDEFAVLIPNTTSEKLEEYKIQISSKIKTLRIENIEQSLAIGYDLKVSIDEDIDGLLKHAENRMYRQKTIDGTSFRSHAINAILKTLTDKHYIEKEHSQRVSKLAKLLGKELHLMRDDEIKGLEQTGLFHDIGKISIPDNILNKPERLTEKEYDIIKSHTEVGYQILRAADEYSGLAIHALHHHEHWDGSGYPSGLKGKDIPLFSRIICICDAYDAMTSDRPYRKKMSKEYAISEILKFAGTQFDPKIAKIFVEKVITSLESK